MRVNSSYIYSTKYIISEKDASPPPPHHPTPPSFHLAILPSQAHSATQMCRMRQDKTNCYSRIQGYLPATGVNRWTGIRLRDVPFIHMHYRTVHNKYKPCTNYDNWIFKNNSRSKFDIVFWSRATPFRNNGAVFPSTVVIVDDSVVWVLVFNPTQTEMSYASGEAVGAME